MDIHSNARTCPNSRATIVEHMKAKAWCSDQAFTMGVSVRTGFKWWRRFREGGLAGLQDRSSRPSAGDSVENALFDKALVALETVFHQI